MKKYDVFIPINYVGQDVKLALEDFFNGCLLHVHSGYNKPVEDICIRKGCPANVKIPFMSDPSLYVVIKENPHPYYNRQGDNLFASMKISFQEALVGFQKVIKTVDGKVITIGPHLGQVIKDGDIRCIHHYGMPNMDNPNIRGDLYIRFSVDLPKFLDEQVAETLSQILDEEKNVNKYSLYKTVELQEFL